MAKKTKWNEVKRSRDKTKIGKEIIWYIFWSHSRMRLLYDIKSNLYNVLKLKCVSITNIKHYMESVIR